MPYDHENTPYGAYGEFLPIEGEESYDWDEHSREAQAFFRDLDNEPCLCETQFLCMARHAE